MTVKIDKNKWIMSALQKGYLIAREDGTILRCVKADKAGNLLTKEYRVVKQQIHKKSGRVYFNLNWLGIEKSVLVNRVIAIRFHPNPDNLPQVNHIDGDKENNAKDNLEWASGSENEKHAHRTGLKSGRGSANSNAKLTADDVLAIRASHESIADLVKRYGVGRSTITNVISRKSWGHI